MEKGHQNSMETVNNRLMGTTLIDKASPSEAKGYVGMEIPGLHPTMRSSD